MTQLNSKHIKQTSTWIALLKEQKLASEFNAYEKKAKNAPNMVSNFVSQLQKSKNEVEYGKFKAQIEQLILDREVCQNDLDFINEKFGLSYFIDQKNFGEGSSASDSGESSNAKGKQPADLAEQQNTIKLSSKTIKQVSTWISLLETQSLKSSYDQFADKATNAPSMVKNFVRRLKQDKNVAQYKEFVKQFETLITNGAVCQQDLDFIIETFDLNYTFGQKNEEYESFKCKAHYLI